MRNTKLPFGTPSPSLIHTTPTSAPLRRNSINSQHLHASHIQLHDMAHRVPPHDIPQLLIRRDLGHDALAQPILDRLRAPDLRVRRAGPQHDDLPRVAERAGRDPPHGGLGLRFPRPGSGFGGGGGGAARRRRRRRLRGRLGRPRDERGAGAARLAVFRGRAASRQRRGLLLRRACRRRRLWIGRWGGRGEELEEAFDVGFVGARDGVALVDEAEEDGFLEVGAVGLLEGEEGDGGRAEGDAVHALEAAGEVVQFGGCGRGGGEHVCVEEGGDGAAGGVASDKKRI